jgi:hypothetical protein
MPREGSKTRRFYHLHDSNGIPIAPELVAYPVSGAMPVLKGPKSFFFFVTFDFVTVRAQELVPTGCVPQHSHVVSQPSAASPSDLRAATAVDMVYLQCSNVFVESADAAPWTVFLVDLPKYLALSFGAWMLSHKSSDLKKVSPFYRERAHESGDFKICAHVSLLSL